MTVIWGFDLSEMSWSSFGHSKMFDRRWHLRRERIVIYQLAMLICLAAECTATYSLSKYEDLQTNVENLAHFTAQLHNNDIIAAQCLLIVFCVLVATIFGADFFFLVMFPARNYPKWYNFARKLFAVGITLGLVAGVLMSTIVVASHAAFITGATPDQARLYTDVYFRPPLQYNRWPTNIAFVVLGWLGLIFTAASTVVMFMAINYDERYGARLALDEKRGEA